MARQAASRPGRRSGTGTGPDARGLLGRLRGQRPIFASQDLATVARKREAVLAQAWSGDALRLALERPNWRFVVPKEGGLLWLDNLCIPVEAPNKEGAHRLVEFLMEAASGARLARSRRYGCVSTAASALLPEPLRNDPLIVLPRGGEAAMAWMLDAPGSSPAEDAAWRELRFRRLGHGP